MSSPAKTLLTGCLALLGVAIVFALLWPREASTEAERQALSEGRVVITYWDRHTGHEHDARRTLIDEFNRSQDAVYVRALSIGYNASMEKLLTSIAGGTPPDLCGLDNSILAQLVAQGCFEPIEDRMAATPTLRKEDFFPFCWDSVCFDGHVWGVPITTDTYCLLWNKSAFRKAGLDPDRPPANMTELEAYAEKLTIRDAGGVQQIGFLPWHPWDMSTMWGYVFGGRWYEEKTGRIVCGDDPNIIRMFRWQQRFARDPSSPDNPSFALDPERIASFQQGARDYSSANNLFYSGRVAMTAEGEWQVTFIPKYAPELDWGVAPLPAPEGAEPVAYGGNPVCDCIPRGCRNIEAAWAYIRWFNTPRPNGGTSPASDYNFAIHNVPPRPAEARQERFVGDPKFKVFVDVLTTRRVVIQPVTPATQFFGHETDRQREQVVYRKITPEEAARNIETNVNAQLEDIRSLIERTRR